MAIRVGHIRCGAQLPMGAPGYCTGTKTCDAQLYVGDRPINRHRLTFVAREDAWIGYRCPRRECGQQYRTTYDELLSVQRATMATATDYRAIRVGEVTRLVPKPQRGSQSRARATSSVGTTPQPR